MSVAQVTQGLNAFGFNPTGPLLMPVYDERGYEPTPATAENLPAIAASLRILTHEARKVPSILFKDPKTNRRWQFRQGDRIDLTGAKPAETQDIWVDQDPKARFDATIRGEPYVVPPKMGTEIHVTRSASGDFSARMSRVAADYLMVTQMVTSQIVGGRSQLTNQIFLKVMPMMMGSREVFTSPYEMVHDHAANTARGAKFLYSQASGNGDGVPFLVNGTALDPSDFYFTDLFEQYFEENARQIMLQGVFITFSGHAVGYDPKLGAMTMGQIYAQDGNVEVNQALIAGFSNAQNQVRERLK